MDTKEIEVVVVQQDGNVVITQPDTFIVSNGEQGPRGIQGAAGIKGDKGDKGDTGAQGPSGSITSVQYTASGSVLGHKIVCLDNNGQFTYASNDNVGCLNRVVGITINGANAGDNVSVVTYGEITEPSWNFDVNTPVFLGLNGNITQTYPTSGFSQIIGFPIATNKLYVKLQEPMVIF